MGESVFKRRIGILSLAHTLKVVLSGRFTEKEIEEATGLHKTTVHRWVLLLKDMKLIHVADFKKCPSGRHNIKIYELGDKPDKVYRRLTTAERSRRYRANLKLKQEKDDE